jgi:hypothetical protein
MDTPKIILDELSQATLKEDATVRLLAKQFFGDDSVLQIIAVGNILLPVVADRMRRYSP